MCAHALWKSERVSGHQKQMYAEFNRKKILGTVGNFLVEIGLNLPSVTVDFVQDRTKATDGDEEDLHSLYLPICELHNLKWTKCSVIFMA